MKVLVVGGGGREHAMCWKLRQSPELTELYWQYLEGGVGDPDPAVAANELIVRLVELTVEPLVVGR